MKFPEADRNLADALADAARDRGEARVVVSSSVRPVDLTLADIAAQGELFAAHLVRLGIGPGDVVAVQLPAWSEWMIACAGIARAGAILLPIVSIYGAKEMSFILRQSGARLIVTPDRWRNADYGAVLAECGDLPDLRHHVVVGPLRPEGAIGWDKMVASAEPVPAIVRAPDDVALLVYTSGTTSDPKGVQHSSRTILSEFAIQSRLRDLDHDRTLSPWPPGHVAGAYAMIRTMLYGGPLVLMDLWDPAEAGRLIEAHGLTSCSFTPFHLSGLLDAADREGLDLSTLTNVMVGAAPVSPTLIERCSAKGLRTYRCYGSSEMPTVSTGFPDDPIDKRLTTEGKPMLGAEIRFIDEDGEDAEEGEIALRGPDLFIGYRDPALNEKAFLPGGWFLTGDVGRLDADGYLQITDRKKDIIIRGGENISSREVEDLLFQHPDVAEAAVVAAPDERMGEVVCAFLIPAPGGQPSLENVRDYFFAAGIARQKTPERVEIVADFPRNSTGKVLKHELRARLRGATTKGT
ncbi:AMP-binding protein [Sphingobium sp. Sx8-8]|uniref:AMP-binding protein n=1 Tax=Sphingobium sp. Sx8-8 TaxID=2933617 RepID=UPI001F58B6D7|nr:AMP-binding protein [Sphingobium sp. Sx8-8]